MSRTLSDKNNMRNKIYGCEKMTKICLAIIVQFLTKENEKYIPEFTRYTFYVYDFCVPVKVLNVLAF